MSEKPNNQNKNKQSSSPAAAYDSPMGVHIPPKKTTIKPNTKPQSKK